MLLAAAVSIWVGAVTAREIRTMPTWASPCGGIGLPAASRDEVFRCEQERAAEIANPPVVRDIDWIGAIGSGAIVLVAGALIVDRITRVRRQPG